MDYELASELSSKGYWPAVAYEYFRDRKYGKALELCRRRLNETPDLISGRVILARALYHSGRIEEAESEFYRILQYDPQNLVALKYIGDIRFANGDDDTAFSYYEKVMKIDLHSPTLLYPIDGRSGSGKAMVLKRNSEDASEKKETATERLPFKTETMGDLLFSQGHTRLAFHIFDELARESDQPRLKEKAEKARALLNKKEKVND